MASALKRVLQKKKEAEVEEALAASLSGSDSSDASEEPILSGKKRMRQDNLLKADIESEEEQKEEADDDKEAEEGDQKEPEGEVDEVSTIHSMLWLTMHCTGGLTESFQRP